MTMVTVVAGLIAVRFEAQFTALIGLAGGLATPVLLSTGVDRPVAFFSYLTLLAAGFLYVAERRRWVSVTALALAGTTDPAARRGSRPRWIRGELLVATVSFTAIGAAYLWHAIRTRTLDTPALHQAALAGAMVPLPLAMLLAGHGKFDDQWAGLLGYLAVVDAGLVVAALVWQFPILIIVSACDYGRRRVARRQCAS